MTTFKSLFSCTDQAAAAEAELMDMQQGSLDLVTYVTRFQQVAGRTDWTDRTRMALFHKGLREDLKDKLARTARAATFSALQDQVLQLEYRIQERRAERRHVRPARSPPL